MTLLTLMDKLFHAIENGEYVMGVFLDFSKAFDTVNHSILLDKPYHYGIRGCAHKWLKSYLTNRTQFVTYNSTVSDHQMIKCGVPLGSILGPLLFLVYVNDLPSVCSSALPISFADDTNLFLSGSDPICIENRMNDDLKEIAMWFKVSKLSLNMKKTHFMVFSGKNKPNPNLVIRIDGKSMHKVEKTKFLGVIIDKRLSWKDHISYISGKIARGIGVIAKARKYLLKNSLINLYYSFIYPYLIYCNHVLGINMCHISELFSHSTETRCQNHCWYQA